MTVPTKQDLNKLQAKINKHKSKLDSMGFPKPLTENTLKQYIRGAVREQWMRSDVKLYVLLSNREPDLNPNTRTKWIHKCAICQQYFKEGDVEIDHVDGHKSYTVLDKSFEWASSILDVSELELQVVCKEDHTIKSYCEANNLDWRNPEHWQKAKLEKEIIAICKGSGCPEKSWLSKRGVSPASNKDLRKQQVRDLLKKSLLTKKQEIK